MFCTVDFCLVNWVNAISTVKWEKLCSKAFKMKLDWTLFIPGNGPEIWRRRAWGQKLENQYDWVSPKQQVSYYPIKNKWGRSGASLAGTAIQIGDSYILEKVTASLILLQTHLPCERNLCAESYQHNKKFLSSKIKHRIAGFKGEVWANEKIYLHTHLHCDAAAVSCWL